MKNLLTLPLVLFTVIAFAQSIKSKETDKFTGVITTTTSKEPLAVKMGFQWVAVSGYRMYDPKSGEQLFTLVFALKGQGIGSLRPKESKITLLTETKEVIDLPYTGEYKLFTGADVTINLFSRVTMEQLEILKEVNITDIRVYTSRLMEHSIRRDRQSSIAGIAKVLLKEAKSDKTSK